MPAVAPLVMIRPMAPEDLPAVRRWLGEPHVASWWISETTAEAEIEKIRRRVEEAGSATRMCSVEVDGRPVGWCQWYRWDDYPGEAAASGARPGEIGADYAIGDRDQIGRGAGTAMIARLVAVVRAHHPGAGLLIAPDAANAPSRRVLEKNGFSLVEVRPIVTEPTTRPMAIYRLAPMDGC